MTPGSTPPDVSRTTPVMLLCAHAAPGASRRTHTRNEVLRTDVIGVILTGPNLASAPAVLSARDTPPTTACSLWSGRCVNGALRAFGSKDFVPEWAWAWQIPAQTSIHCPTPSVVEKGARRRVRILSPS